MINSENLSKWMLGGAGAVVIGAIVVSTNFVAGAVWDKITLEIVTAAKAQVKEELSRRVDGIENKAVNVEQEVGNLRTTQMTLIEETGDLKDAVKANSALTRQVLELLQERPPQ